MIDDPAVLFRRGDALPAGAPRTMIVLGAARGGTTMVAQMLHDLGIFMGEGLGSTCQDAAFGDVSRALFHGRIAIDHPAIEELLRRRDRQFDVWGWKFTSHLFEPLYDKARNPHLIAVFRDPVAIATRESVSQACAVEPCFERAFGQIEAFAKFVLATPYPCLAVSYERGLARKAELIDALVAFAGVAASPEARRRAAERARPGSSAYLVETGARRIEGTLDRVDGHVAGWLRYPREPGRRVSFTIEIDGAPVWRGAADRFRADLQRAFDNDGRCGFEVPLPDRLRDGKSHSVRIRVPDESDYLIANNDADWTIARR